MTRNEAIKEAGIKTVEAVETENVDFTNRVTDGTNDAGYVEFSASVDFVDNDDNACILTMILLIDEDEVNASDDLDQIDWDAAIKDAKFEIF